MADSFSSTKETETSCSTIARMAPSGPQTHSVLVASAACKVTGTSSFTAPIGHLYGTVVRGGTQTVGWSCRTTVMLLSTGPTMWLFGTPEQSALEPQRSGEHLRFASLGLQPAQQGRSWV